MHEMGKRKALPRRDAWALSSLEAGHSCPYLFTFTARGSGLIETSRRLTAFYRPEYKEADESRNHRPKCLYRQYRPKYSWRLIVYSITMTPRFSQSVDHWTCQVPPPTVSSRIKLYIFWVLYNSNRPGRTKSGYRVSFLLS